MLRIINILIAWPGRERWLLDIITPDVLQSIQNVITSGLPLHTLDLTTPLKDRFSDYLLSLLPGEGKAYCLQFCGPSGADAVEAALKLAKSTPAVPA